MPKIAAQFKPPVPKPQVTEPKPVEEVQEKPPVDQSKVTIKIAGDTESLTTQYLAEKLGVEYSVAQGLIKFLTTYNGLTVSGKKPNSSGRGKGSVIYDIPKSISITFND